MIHTGTDFDNDRFVINKAYITYWDCERRVIASTTMWAETIWPLNIVQAIKTFAPEFARGANVTFESILGTSKLTVMEF